MKKLFTSLFAILMVFGLAACDSEEMNHVDQTDEESHISAELEVVEPGSEESEKITVQLYYYNLEKDKEIDESIPCSAEAVLPVEREITESLNVPAATLRLLINGNITDEEAAQGFQTEFEPGKLSYKSLMIKDGVATIEFDDDGGFTSGGSCRAGLLATQIKKTLLQFDEVDEVIFANEDMFQP